MNKGDRQIKRKIWAWIKSNKLFIFSLFFLVYILSGYLDFTCRYLLPDSFWYLIVSKSLAEGSGCQLISYPIKHSCNLVDYLYITYPLMLTPAYLLRLDTFIYGKLLSTLFTLGVFTTTYLIGKEYFQNKIAIAYCFLVILSPTISEYARRILTDIPYLFISTLAIYLISYYEKKRDKKILPLVVTLLIISLFTRPVAIILVFSILLYRLASSKKNTPTILAIFSASLLMLFIAVQYSLIHEISINNISNNLHRYLYEFHVDNSFRVIRSINHIEKIVPREIAEPLLTLIKPLLRVLVLLSTFFGLMKSKRNVVWFYTTTYITIALLFLSKSSHRILIPVIPFMTLYFLLGVKTLFKKPRLHLDAQKIFILFLSILLIKVIGGALQTDNYYKSMCRPSVGNYYLALEWIKDNTQKNDIIICSQPHASYLYTGRKSIDWDIERILSVTSTSEKSPTPSYILLGSYSGGKLEDKKKVINQNTDKLKLVFKTEDPPISVYKIDYRPEIQD